VSTGGGRTLRTRAHAKVNLGLAVTARRDDGYHELRSVFLRLDLADEVILGPAVGAADALVIEGDPGCPVEGNLALAALAAWRARIGPVGSLAIHLRKSIPMAAGLGGGSADAAAVLRLIARWHPGAAVDGPLRSVARAIGADVPFFLEAAGAALVWGVGEELEPLPPPIEPLGVLLVKPTIELLTGRVFGSWDRLGSAPPAGPSVGSVVDDLATELRAGASPATLVGLAPRLRDANELWSAAVALEPRMEASRAALEATLGVPFLMSGSGSTMYALYSDPDHARQAARMLEHDPDAELAGAWVAATATGTPYPPEVVSVEEGS
jgi:4-diphosphocytidyl-2-C-methyl-D-erythritol kinase